MDKIEIIISSEDLEIIKKEMKTNPKEKVRNKAKVLYLRNKGCTEKEIINKTDLSLCTILSYIKAYKKNGLKSIYTTAHKGQPSKLNNVKDEIISDFKKNPPKTRAEAVARIKENWNIKTSITAVGNFLKKTECHTKKQEISQQKLIKKNKENF